MPVVDLEAAQHFRFVARHMPHGLGKCPDMAFRVARPVGALAIELISRFLHDLGTGPACAFAMRVQSAGQLQIHTLRVLAANGNRAGDVVRPLMVDDDIGICEAHLGMHQPARWIGDQHAAPEAESAPQPFEPVHASR